MENKYKFNLIYEYRDIVAKVQNLERFIVNYEKNVASEKDNESLKLLRQQLEILRKYEVIISQRIEFEMTK